MAVYEIDGFTLTAQKAAELAADAGAQVALSAEAAARCRASRAQIDRWLLKDAPVIYGVNTGLGNLKDVVMPPEDHIKWNRTIPYPHAAGFGEYLAPEITRLALLLRANVLARAYSAVRVELIERMLALFNAGIAPAVRGAGSTGLSDLAPLSQCVMTVAGLPEAMAFYKGELVPSTQACSSAGLAPTFELECKEVLAQMNGSTMTQAIAVLAFRDFLALRAGLEGRFSPERASACRAVMELVQSILDRENNISCDNPLLFETQNGNYEAVMGCNCSNTQVGYAMDLMCVLCAELGQELAAALGQEARMRGDYLLMRLKALCIPVSADSIPTKGAQEDHVEFSYSAARKFAQALAILEQLAGATQRKGAC